MGVKISTKSIIISKRIYFGTIAFTCTIKSQRWQTFVKQLCDESVAKKTRRLMDNLSLHEQISE